MLEPIIPEAFEPRPGQGVPFAAPRIPAAPRRRAAALALAFLAGAGAPAAGAPAQPPSWVLDRFSVTFFDYGQPSRNEVRDAASRSFGFGGEYAVPGGNRYTAPGMLTVSVPDRIESGGAYQAGARATGDVTAAGPIRAEGEPATLEVRSLCWDDDVEDRARDEKRVLPAAPTVSLAAAVPPRAFTAPAITGPTTPASHNCEFRAELRAGLAVAWQVSVQAQYKQSRPTAPYLTLDANPVRLPPSGASPSESVLTAALFDAAGRPIAGQRIDLRLEPPDLGRLAPATGTTDAAGVVRATYTAPRLAELRGRDRAVVRAVAPGRGLERSVGLDIESYRLALTVEPDRLPITDPPGSARLRVVAERFDGRPAADDIVELTLDPPDMGRLIGDRLLGNRVVTDAQGVAEVFYEAPAVAAMRHRDLVTVFGTNISHGGAAAAAIRFQGLRVVRTQPFEGARDVDLRPGGAPAITFDRAIDPASVDGRTVRVTTLWHGDLASRAQAAGDTVQATVLQDPVPDVGLVVTVRVAGGADGVRGADGSLLPGDVDLRFMTLPRLSPRVIVSQVVDDPLDPVHGVVSIAPKPFVLRVAGGLPADSELTGERASVTLTAPGLGTQELDHTFYPGDWPPRVPDAAVRSGNTANFHVRAVPPAGGLAVTAAVRPFFAPDAAAVAAAPVTVDVHRWSSPRVALGIGVLFVPLQNDHLPGYAWTVSRGQLAQWSAGLGADAVRFLPLPSVPTRLGYYMDTTCHDPDRCDFERRPWTELSYWARHVGRAGFGTPWSYVVPVVPPGWFAARFEGHPDVVANPDRYHNMVNNGIWSDAAIPGEAAGAPPVESPILEADASDAAFVHALGDTRGLPHSTAARDDLAGYDLAGDRAIRANAEGWTGAFLSVMNQDVGYGREWITRLDYAALLDRWTQRACVGVPPCPPGAPGGGPGDGDAGRAGRRMPHGDRDRGGGSRSGGDPGSRGSPGVAGTAGRGRPDDDPAAGGDPVPLIGVTGTILDGATAAAAIEPLIWFDGHPTAAGDGTGAYAVVLRDAAGAVLGRHAFTPVFGPVDGGRLASFVLAVPRPAGVASVAVVDGAAELGSVRKGPNAPEVAFTRPAAGATFRGDVAVAWAGHDADGDRLSYRLRFSGDGGQTWLPLLVDSPRTAYTLPAADLPNGPDARLRVVASDGFAEAEAEVAFRLDGTPRVVASVPEPGARGVSPSTVVAAVVRDPLDPATVNGATFVVRDASGRAGAGRVAGAVAYQPLDGSVRFVPAAPLAEARVYEARLTTGARTPDGRALPDDHVWRFTTRGRTLYLPRAQQSGNANPAAGSPVPTRTLPPLPTSDPSAAPPTPPPPTWTAPAPSPTATRGTAPATAGATTTPPSAVPPTTPAPPSSTPGSPTPATPTSAPSPTTSPTPLAGGVEVTDAWTTGADPTRLRQAFAPGEAIQLSVGVDNATGGPAAAAFEFVVVGDNGFAPDTLAWRGTLQLAPGASGFKLERAVPAGMPAGPYRLLVSAGFGGRSSTATADFFVADAVRRVDDFDDPASGWTSHADADVRSGYLNGAFQILVRTANFWRLDTPNDSVADFAMEADVAFAGSAAGAAGLVSGMSADGQAFTVFVVVRDGRFGLFRRAGGAWQAVHALTPSGAVAPDANHVMLARMGSELRLYANGRLLAVVAEPAGARGRVGLFGEAIDAGLDARFDAFRLYDVR